MEKQDQQENQEQQQQQQHQQQQQQRLQIINDKFSYFFLNNKYPTQHKNPGYKNINSSAYK